MTKLNDKPVFYDELECRPAHERQLAQFDCLREILVASRKSAPALDAQLAGIDISQLDSFPALAKIPVMRKNELGARQTQHPPFGGFDTIPPSNLKRLLVSPGPLFEPEGYDADWWGTARAVFAAGIRRGDIVLNCFSYHLTPGGHIMESGAHALGCPVIPGGTGNTEQQLEAIAFLKPTAYMGTPDFLKILLDKGQALAIDTTSIRNALVSGAALPQSLRNELHTRGVEVAQCYATADLGIIAYESSAREGLIVNETVIVEIVRPGGDDPLPCGEVGEVVVTRLNRDYPLVRFGTGDLSSFLPGTSPCGRTNMRLKGWLGRADQTTKVKGMFVHPAQMNSLLKQFTQLHRLRLVIGRANEMDTMLLRAECEHTDAAFIEMLAAALQAATKLRGDVEIVAPGTLPNDGKIIADERPVG